MSATVIIPTTGSPDVVNAIDSVLNQVYPTTCYLVCDGDKFRSQVETIVAKYRGDDRLKVCYLPINVGANGFYGHRIYASFTHLIDTKYVLYLDQDCWLDKNHVQMCVNKLEKGGYQWVYSLRKIYDKDGTFICNDDCESLGKWQTYHGIHHIDTNCYCIKTEIAVKLASAWHGGWGQDRVFLHTLSHHFTSFDCTGLYTTNYKVDGNAGSVNADFFHNGNKIMNEKYNGVFPWQKRI